MKAQHHHRGFSLVELMVAMVVGMLAMMFVARTMSSFESTRRAGVGGSDSLQNGMVAMFTMQNEISKAGWDINDNMVLGCNAFFSDKSGFSLTVGTGINPTPIVPVLVNFSSNDGDPDTITTYSGSSFGGAGSYPLASGINAGDTQLILDDPAGFGFNAKDVLLIVKNGGPCGIVEAAAPPVKGMLSVEPIVKVDITGMRFTPATGVPIAIDKINTHVFNLGQEGSLAFHRWSVVGGRLMLQGTNVVGSIATPQAVVDNIVSIKALYGFDTRVISSDQLQATLDKGLVVGKWSRSMIDADGDGVVGGQGDYQRMAAIRLAVVARSREVEKLPSSGTCTTTPVAPKVFQSQEPAGVTSTPITVNVTVTGDTVPWQCYSYKVFETIIPIRNVGWRPGNS